jgi:hypothetical protein
VKSKNLKGKIAIYFYCLQNNLRMKAILLLLVAAPLFVQAQKKKKDNPSDSIEHYNYELDRLKRQAIDSVFKSSEYKDAYDRLNYYASRSDGYNSFMIFAELADADFDELHKTIVPNGFERMNRTTSRVGFGVSSKHHRAVTDFAFFVGGFDNESTRGEETIKSRFSSALQVDFGYDLTKSTKINVYPYVGTAIRVSFISYSRSGTSNPNFTDISNININGSEIQENSTKLGYQAGIGFDFVFHQNWNRYDNGQRTSGQIIFIKAGTNGSFGKETYRINGIKYRPGIEHGRWIITVGFKFFARQ